MTPRSDGVQADRLTTSPSVVRLSELLGLEVATVDGRRLGLVREVRLRRSRSSTGALQLVTEGLVVGRRPHDVRWGYDRHPRQGPLVVAVVARRVHRRDRYLPWRQVHRIDLDHHVLTVLDQPNDSRGGNP